MSDEENLNNDLMSMDTVEFLIIRVQGNGIYTVIFMKNMV